MGNQASDAGHDGAVFSQGVLVVYRTKGCITFLDRRCIGGLEVLLSSS